MPKIEKSLLAKLSGDTSVSGRKKLIDAVSELFISDGEALRSSERGVAYDILRVTIHEIEKDVRRKIAEQVSERTDVPDELLGVLADDDIEIAFPILAYSPLLDDEDLIRVIRSKTTRYQQAVTLRDNLSDSVTDELVATDDLAVIRSLLSNGSANISYDSMEKLTQRSRREVSLQELLLSRDDLPLSLAEKMFTWVKVVLRQYILDNFKIDASTMDGLLVDVVFEDVRKIRNMEMNDGTSGGPVKVRNSYVLGGQDTVADLLLTALSEKRILDFLTLFERKFGLPQSIMLRALSDKRCEGLGVAIKSAKLGKAVYMGILSHLRLSKIDNDSKIRNEITRCMKFFDSVEDKVATEIVDAWKSNQDFAFALSKINAT